MSTKKSIKNDTTELFKRRSEAAKKGVLTRKANELFKKRSEAARKGALTRKARQSR